MKGKTIGANLNITMNPDTAYCLFVQKRSCHDDARGRRRNCVRVGSIQQHLPDCRVSPPQRHTHRCRRLMMARCPTWACKRRIRECVSTSPPQHCWRKDFYQTKTSAEPNATSPASPPDHSVLVPLFELIAVIMASQLGTALRHWGTQGFAALNSRTSGS
jgi:hypothetical protein